MRTSYFISFIICLTMCIGIRRSVCCEKELNGRSECDDLVVCSGKWVKSVFDGYVCGNDYTECVKPSPPEKLI